MAQQDKATFENYFNNSSTGQFKDNTTKDITPSRARTLISNIKDSILFWLDNVKDEDNMSSDSASHVPTQQSVKAYVDAQTGAYNTDVKFYNQFDFITSSGYNDFSLIANGAGASNPLSSVGVDNTEHALGVLESTTGTTNAGRAGIHKSGQIVFAIGFQYQWRFRQALSALSDGTDTYTVYLGFGDNVNAGTHTEGAFFRYTHGTNGGRWQAVTVTGGVETAEDTGVTPVAGVYDIFQIVVNAAGTQVDFYINGTKTNDITTTIPGASSGTGLNFKIVKSAGTTARSMYQDWHELLITRTTAR